MTMEIHHGHHHKMYVDDLNKAIAGHAELERKPIEMLLRDIASVPQSIRQAVIKHGGAHANHTVFWQIMGPDGSNQPSGPLADRIKLTFGDFAELKRLLKLAGLVRFGSGWAWLVLADGKLQIVGTANEDSPLVSGHAEVLLHQEFAGVVRYQFVQSAQSKIPILGIDMWEHAFYLRYQHRRDDYLDAWWNVVNWKAAEKRFEAAQSGKH